jgi:hypothetical protein
MDVNEVIALVTTALGSAPFRITGTTLQSPPISTLLSGHLGADALVLDGAAEAERDASGITVTGTLAAPQARDQAAVPADGPVHGLIGLAASARFTVTGGIPQVRVTFSGLPPGWEPSMAVPALAGTVLDAVAYTSPWIALDSANSDALPDGFPLRYGFAAFSAETAEVLVRGMSIGGTAALTGLPPDLGLLTGSAWQVSGEVALLPSAVAACLVTAPSAHPFSIGGYEIPFSVALAAAPVPSAPAPGMPGEEGISTPLPTMTSSLIQLEADIEKDVGSAGAPHVITLPVLLRTTPYSGGVYALGAALSGTPPVTLTQLASLVDGHALDDQVPKTAGFPVLDDIVLKDVSVVFAPAAQQQLVSIGATVALANPDPAGWPVFGRLIVFKGMSISFLYIPELDALITEATAEAVLADGTLDASIRLPDLTFSLELAEGTSIDIKKLVDQLTRGSVTMPQVNCAGLELGGDVRAGSYSFRADVTDDWSFSIGGKPFALTRVGFALNYDGNIPSGQANGVFTVAGLELYAIANYDGATSSWSFEGGTVTPADIDLPHLAADLAGDLGISVPVANAPAGLRLDNLNVFYDTFSEHLQFAGLTTFEIVGFGCALALSVEHSQGSTAFTGTLYIGLQAFLVDFSTDSQRTRLSASWSAEDSEGGLDLKGLSEELGFTPPQIPAELHLSLTSASITYDKALVLEADSAAYGKAAFIAGRDASGQRGFVFGVLPKVAVTLDLTTIDVIGKLVPSGDDIISLSNLRIVGASSALPAYPPPPEVQQVIGTVVNSGLMLSAELKAGTAIDQTLTVRFGGAGGGSPADTSPSQTAIAVRGGASAAPQALWINVQRSFGPVHFERVGFTITSQAELSVLLDAAVSVAGLTVGLTGLQASMPIRSPYVPSFDLAGLQVQFSGGGVAIGGGLEKVPGSTPAEYTGELTVQLARFGATMFGSYTTVDGQPSLFAFLFLDAPLGGPAFFFVTGLAGGFGYNRSLKLPDISGVESYPLVAGAMGTLDAAHTQSQLTALIQVAPNEDWLAAGVRFTSFEMVRSFALLTVAFGTHTEIALLGESTISVPVPAEGETVTPVAQADLVLMVDVSPANGQLAVSAQLTPQSYVLDPAAHLTGGFAFYAWFPPSAQPGDFVVTLGGYNPYFTPPSYYPQQVPQLGLSWQLPGGLSVSGGLYFALTPSVLMAGGYLRATWQSGDLSAWFDTQADFLMRFKPFSYGVTISVSIGASFTVDLWVTTLRITIYAGVSLVLWGPPFGGTAQVHLSIISFTIGFGSTQPDQPAPVDWPKFRRSFLPPANSSERHGAPRAPLAAPAPGAAPPPTPTDSLVTISAAQGLLATVTSRSTPVWVVSPASLQVVVTTQVPSTSASVVTSATITPSGTWTDRLGVGPMGAGAGALEAKLTIAIDHDKAPDPDSWAAAASTGGVPKGLYLDTAGQMQTDGTIHDALLGVTLTPAPPTGGSTLPVPVAELLCDRAVCQFGWSAVVPPDSDSFDQNTAMDTMRTSLTDSAGVRRDLLAALRQHGLQVAADVDVGHFAAAAPGLMASPPLLRVLGEQVPPTAAGESG